MKKVCLLCWLLMAGFADIHAQSITEKLKVAAQALEKDPQLGHGIMGFYVVDAKTGNVVYEKNAQMGLAAASVQKIITSATSFDLLGKGFRFKTFMGDDKEIRDEKLLGNLYITGNGDPTLGSWRWNSTDEDAVLERIADILIKNSIKNIAGDIFIDDVSYTLQPIPDGWIWQDIGNYYGAGCWSFNWRENQYDVVIQSDENVGGQTKIVRTIPVMADFILANFITTGKKNSGDNAYIYAPPFSRFGFATGTIPPGEKSFTISGAMSNPVFQFSKALEQKLKQKNIAFSGQIQLNSDIAIAGKPLRTVTHLLDSISSPTLDSINYWFMKKSINLYGEALVKAIAYRQQQYNATTGNGIQIIREFWKSRGINTAALNIIDGSGLSPQNRVTAHALVKVLQYAKTRPWYQSFYQSLPEYNGMKIKSGSIGGARAFAGYHLSSVGREYILAIIVNNYDGSAGDIVKKMYKVLDVLK